MLEDVDGVLICAAAIERLVITAGAESAALAAAAERAALAAAAERAALAAAANRAALDAATERPPPKQSYGYLPRSGAFQLKQGEKAATGAHAR